MKKKKTEDKKGWQKQVSYNYAYEECFFFSLFRNRQANAINWTFIKHERISLYAYVYACIWSNVSELRMWFKLKYECELLVSIFLLHARTSFLINLKLLVAHNAYSTFACTAIYSLTYGFLIDKIATRSWKKICVIIDTYTYYVYSIVFIWCTKYVPTTERSICRKMQPM